MSKKKGKGLVPKLRFPGFEGGSDWTETKLSKLGELVSGLTYSPSDLRKDGLLVLRSSNVQNGNIYLEDNVYVRDDIKGANLSQPKDILICVRNGSKPLIGKNALIPSGLPRCTHGAFMTVLRSLGPDFVFQLLQTENYQKQVSADLGATINSINGGQLKKYRFWVPDSVDERQKIADCLSSLDDLITAHTKKHEALKTYKKGLMQNLFPAEGASVPELRFPGFEGEWEEFKGSDVFHQISNKEHDSDLPVLAITQEHGAIPRDLINYHVSATEKSIQSYKVVEIGDFIISLRSFQGGIEYSYFKGICSPAYVILRKKIEIIDGFFRQLFKTQSFIKILTKNLEGLRDGKMISFNQFSEIEFTVPDVTEQLKISDCLSSLDDLIAAEDKKIKDLKAHKKGLMQQLFPIVDKVSE